METRRRSEREQWLVSFIFFLSLKSRSAHCTSQQFRIGFALAWFRFVWFGFFLIFFFRCHHHMHTFCLCAIHHFESLNGYGHGRRCKKKSTTVICAMLSLGFSFPTEHRLQARTLCTYVEWAENGLKAFFLLSFFSLIMTFFISVVTVNNKRE